MKLLASVMVPGGVVELQAETPHQGDADAPIALVLPGFQMWMTMTNARALVAFVEFAIKVREGNARAVEQ